MYVCKIILTPTSTWSGKRVYIDELRSVDHYDDTIVWSDDGRWLFVSIKAGESSVLLELT